MPEAGYLGSRTMSVYVDDDPTCITSNPWRWQINGEEGFGEDQDVWSMARFADRRLGEP